jgi:hypothetical protein
MRLSPGPFYREENPFFEMFFLLEGPEEVKPDCPPVIHRLSTIEAFQMDGMAGQKESKSLKLNV